MRSMALAQASQLLALLPSGSPAPAATEGNGAPEISQLALERWSHEVGLAGGLVRDIVEDRTGFLWLATSGGLSRFDGRSFRNFTAATEPNLPGSQVHAIALGPDGLVRIGLEHGGVRIVDERGVRLSPRVEALPPVVVRSLLADAAGTLWIGTDRGLWRSGSGGLAAVRLSHDAQPADVRKLVAARDGSTWVRTYAQGLRRVEAGTVSRVPDAPGCRGLALAFGPDGGAVTSCVDGIWERGAGESTWRRLVDAGEEEHVVRDRRLDQRVERHSPAGVMA